MITATETPEQTAVRIMRAMSTADLLRHAYALTHRLHEATDKYDAAKRGRSFDLDAVNAQQRVIAALREQRNMIDAELISRDPRSADR